MRLDLKLGHYHTQIFIWDTAYKKDKYRSKGKDRRCCLGDRIYSVPCCASYILHQDKEKDEIILFFPIILVQFILLLKSSSAK